MQLRLRSVRRRLSSRTSSVAPRSLVGAVGYHRTRLLSDTGGEEGFPPSMALWCIRLLELLLDDVEFFPGGRLMLDCPDHRIPKNSMVTMLQCLAPCDEVATGIVFISPFMTATRFARVAPSGQLS